MATDMWRGQSEGMALRDAMNRLFEQAFVGPTMAEWTRPNGNNGGVNAARVPLNVYEDNEAFHVWALMPGADPERITITATGQSVTIEAEMTPTFSKEWRPLWSEWQPMRWRREVTLPAAANVEQANVAYENGVLHIRLPKPEAVRPRTLKVNVRGK